MILLWGLPGDTPLASVRQALARLAANVAFVDQGEVLSTSVEFTIDSGLTGRICGPAGDIPLEDVTAVYLRPYSSIDLLAVKQAGWMGADPPSGNGGAIWLGMGLLYGGLAQFMTLKYIKIHIFIKMFLKLLKEKNIYLEILHTLYLLF